ncbi:MAG: ectoine/hydroxyectoine ABC transporter permease subunit EhuD, partial [Inquilinus limosus]|nr:ectoine/hydroxyectoine ABC transporter permease subunit EhuD [Inquilinus limosus]
MDWDWAFVVEILPTLIQGVKITILATILGYALAVVLGLGLALLRRTRRRWLARTVNFLIEFIRGTPLLVQLYFLFYIMPDLGLTLSPLTAGVIGLGLHYATYTAEVYRAGIDNTPRGQWEAAKACNLTAGQSWRHVILPQAIPPMLPALANYF